MIGIIPMLKSLGTKRSMLASFSMFGFLVVAVAVALTSIQTAAACGQICYKSGSCQYGGTGQFTYTCPSCGGGVTACCNYPGEISGSSGYCSDGLNGILFVCSYYDIPDNTFEEDISGCTPGF